MKIKGSLTAKILLSMCICIFTFTFFSNLILATLLGNRLSDRSGEINEQYLTVIRSQLEGYLSEINTLATICSSDPNIYHALRYESLDSLSAKKMALKAQTSLDGYLTYNILSPYTSRFVAFNMKDIAITCSLTSSNSLGDTFLLRNMVAEHFASGSRSPLYTFGLSPFGGNEPVMACLYPIAPWEEYYMYIEIRPEFLKASLAPYRNLLNIYITDENHLIFYSTFTQPDQAQLIKSGNQADRTLKMNGMQYRLSIQELSRFGIKLCLLNVVTFAGGDNTYILYLMAVILITTLCAGLLVTRLLSTRLTRPIQILNHHISHITETSDFSPDPAIETSPDEIGAIGKAVNRMTLHIRMLLKQTEEMYEQRKNIEISLLQSQINPHFLYNTLDSIRWMAVIQKSKNIEHTTRALENLLRNMAKGVGDKIDLKTELSLVEDYVHIQKVRYVEVFDYVCDVPCELTQYCLVKFTIQPIVENAIFHGIEPTGRFGEIRLSAHADDTDLFIAIEDNGAGMTAENLANLKDTLKNSGKDSLSGIGITNVDARLKLIYGQTYGLIYESVPNVFTRVTIHIPKEVKHV